MIFMGSYKNMSIIRIGYYENASILRRVVIEASLIFIHLYAIQFCNLVVIYYFVGIKFCYLLSSLFAINRSLKGRHGCWNLTKMTNL